MKKLFYLLTILLFFTSISVKSQEKKIKFNDLNTLNFEEKINNEEFFSQIKKICTYNFCDYAKGDTINDKLYNFEESYFNTLDNDDLISELKVKGVKITKVYTF